MKITKLVLAGVIAAITSSSAFAQTVINVTGATAFRAASHNAILTVMQGQGTTNYAYIGTQGLAGSNRAIFKGTWPGIPGQTIVRTSWSGSTAGIAALINATPVQVLVTSTTTSTTGTNITSPTFETAVAKFSFSDVAQSTSPTPSPVLDATPVGVVPFMFVASPNAPAGMTNMTDQLHNSLWGTGITPASMFTGDANDAGVFVYPTGRDSGSGTRATILSETGYGPFIPVQQWTGTVSSGNVTTLTFVENGGYTSNSFIRDLIIANPSAVAVEGGDPAEIVIAGYLTISDALVATTTPNTAKALTYNGVAYSQDNVKNGAYSLWGYQQFFNVSGITADEGDFKNALVNAIPSTLGTAGIPIPDMMVTRFGSDGGPIFSNF